jgi:LPS-assembly lipoprotein
MSWCDPRHAVPLDRARNSKSRTAQHGIGSTAAHPHTRRAALVLCLGALTLGAGCGFKPLYSTGGSGSALDGDTIVVQGGGVNDFTLSRALQDRLGTPGDTPRFRLATTLSIAAEQVAVTASQSINRYNLIGRVNYTLTEIATGSTVRAGRVDGFNSYSASGTSLATRAAQRDATERLMVILADRVMLDLLAFSTREGRIAP